MADVGEEMSHVERVRALAARIGYGPNRVGYRVVVGETEGMRYPYVQVQHQRPDSVSGEISWGGGGKAYVSEWVTDSEFFQLVLGLMIAYETHEVREGFLVDGVRAYGPHVSIEAHQEVADRLDRRPPP